MIIHNESDKNRAIKYIQALNIDKPWSVDIELYKKNRSLSQNKLYWKWITCIGDSIGYGRDELHAIMADKFLPNEIVEYGGKQIKKDKSTSRLNTKEFTEYLEKIDRFAAAELGIILPSPEDCYYEAMGIKRDR
ncbi:recombination protein NinB [Candidatus Pacearchaeota archaeon]|nr:recombination protein NinB [Candidatus Pacearchaeota archaeon]